MGKNENQELEESKSRQLRRYAETLPHLPNLSIKTGNFRKAYREGRKFYKERWRSKEQPSKAFDNKIVKATNKGLSHLISKTVVTNFADAMKRLKHIPNAKQIIEKAEDIYETTKEVEKRGKIINRHVLIGKLETGEVLKVVVKEQDDKFTFTTVYVTKIKMDSKETQT